MGTYKTAIRAKRKRARDDYWRKMRPVIAFLAALGAHVGRAKLRRIGRAMGEYLRDRMRQPSMFELLLMPVTKPVPIVESGKADLRTTLELINSHGLSVGGNSPLVYEIGADGVVSFSTVNEDGSSSLVMCMDLDTFDQIRNESTSEAV